LPTPLGLDAAPAAPGDEVFGVGPPLVGDEERGQRADLEVAEPVSGRLAEHADLGVERGRQPVPVIVAVGRIPDRGRPSRWPAEPNAIPGSHDAERYHEPHGPK
jgi:hypothetical protein